MRTLGTVARGVRTPMIQPGDDLAAIVVDSMMAAIADTGHELQDRDVIGMTEAVVARAQNNYANVRQIAADIRNKFGGEDLAICFPILSRNRFANLLRGIAAGCSKLYIILSYPADEVGNQLVDWDMLDEAGVNPYTDILDEAKYRELFGYDIKHPFTGVDYVDYYKSFGDHVELIFANDPRAALKYSRNVLACDIHSRQRTKRLLREAGAGRVYGLDDILNESIDGSGFNKEYGLLGSNKATEDKVKLFPRDCQSLVEKIQKMLIERTGKKPEVMVYGDGAFKDPVGKIWELADPVVSPGYTEGLIGTPNELKLKFLLDNNFAGKSETEARKAMTEAIKNKDEQLGNQALGTTPRRYTDLLGSLCDLMSGSGDKGTPVIWISGYFENFAAE